MKNNPISEQTKQEAMAAAKATQVPGQTKEQTKLIAKGIEKGIAEYKKRQKSKARELDKKRKKLDFLQKSINDDPQSNDIEEAQETKTKNNLLCLSLLSLSWLVFGLYVISQ